MALEICSLTEIGYPLTQTQTDLTFIQKTFLNTAYTIYNKHIKQQTENPQINNDPNWKERQKRLLEMKWKKL